MADQPHIPGEAVRLAAEAIEDEAVRRLGRDLGTVHRDEIVRAGLTSAYQQFVERWREHVRDQFAAAETYFDQINDVDEAWSEDRERHATGAAAYRSRLLGLIREIGEDGS